jgi:tRNA U34 5-carboxymethylaminomethyl modifying enzyme MnmG/GidA
MDKQESAVAPDELKIKMEKITQGLARLKERTIKYDALQQQLNDTTDNQISTTDISKPICQDQMPCYL